MAKVIDSTVLRNFDRKTATISRIKDIIIYYIKSKNPDGVQQFYNIYTNMGGKLSLNQLRKIAGKTVWRE